jgi:hypothetical protein
MSFNASIGQLPDNLRELNISRAYAFDRALGALPIALEKLCLHTNYQQPVTGGSSTLVCTRLSLPSHDTTRAQTAAEAAAVVAAAAVAAAAPIHPIQQLLDHFNIPLDEDDILNDNTDTDSDDDYYRNNNNNNTFEWRCSYDNDDHLYY